MSEAPLQNLKNHGRLDPPYHFVLGFFLIANLVFAVFHFVHHLHSGHMISAAWFLVLSVVVFIPYAKLRTYPLKVQDRIIRLEEKLRLQLLAPADWRPQISRLTEDQLIALRFASDGEVVELARQALEQNLTRKQIKERIQNWRPDHWRV